jgi:WD40 repeat protein
MAVQFVPKTHYVFSVGKDRVVKYWDADKFEQLLTLEGHHADIWCLAVSNRGDFIVTGSHDRSIRRWDRTEEQFFIEVYITCTCGLWSTTLMQYIGTCPLVNGILNECPRALLTKSKLINFFY